mmetsp:Transcript_3222/g.9827  ORF Transcript_3222/g.9827 Transcript_3222/m.9827 type:complete len:143 (+) Transcript_3222:125-553(+)
MELEDITIEEMQLLFPRVDEEPQFNLETCELLLDSREIETPDTSFGTLVTLDSEMEREREFEDLVNHMLRKSQQRQKGATCATCDRHFARDYDMRRHVRQTHEKIRPHKCILCGKDFARNAHLQSHLANRHNVEKANKRRES